jgi:hypothetical protein
MSQREDDQANAFLAHIAMEETRDYLERGRHFSGLSTEELKRSWTDAFKLWCAHRTAESQREFDDLAAELRLRGEEPPYETVEAETREMVREVKETPFNLEDDPVVKKIDEYHRKRAKPNS